MKIILAVAAVVAFTRTTTVGAFEGVSSTNVYHGHVATVKVRNDRLRTFSQKKMGPLKESHPSLLSMLNCYPLR